MVVTRNFNWLIRALPKRLAFEFSQKILAIVKVVFPTILVVPTLGLVCLTACAVLSWPEGSYHQSSSSGANTKSQDVLQQDQKLNSAASQYSPGEAGYPQPNIDEQSPANVNNSDSLIRQDLGRKETRFPGLEGLPCLVDRLPPLASLSPMAGHKADIAGVFPLRGCSGSKDFVLSADLDGQVYIWILTSGEAYEIFKIPSKIDVIEFSERDGLFAVGTPDMVIKLFSAVDGKEVRALDKVKSRFTSLAFSPDGKSLAIGAANGQVYRWNFELEARASTKKETERILERYTGHPTVVSALAYHPWGRVFFSADWNGAISAWFAYDADVFGGEYDDNLFGNLFFSQKSLRSKVGHSGNVSVERLAVSGDGQRILAALKDGRLEVWKVRGFKKAGEIQAHPGLIYAIALSPDAKKAVSVGRDDKLIVWRLEEATDKVDRDKQLKFIQGKQYTLPGVRQVVFIDAQRILAGKQNGEILDVNLEVPGGE